MTILNPQTLPVGRINRLPSNFRAISYTYMSDGKLFLRAHMNDKFARLKQQGDLPADFSMCPMVFSMELDARTFVIKTEGYRQTFAQLRGTKIVNGEIHMTPKLNMSNVDPSTFRICWGRNYIPITTSLHELINLFFDSYFNGDYQNFTLVKTQENIAKTRKSCSRGEFERAVPSAKLITTSFDVNALCLLHRISNYSIFFWLEAAGFKPIPECRDIMFIPLKEVVLTDNGDNFSGFVTQLDACKKKWFFLSDGTFVGQLDGSQTVQLASKTA
jgi:hypothetical protein